jgi:ribulose-5-phosphate 4-epimerase/fuculose-1-phosphate aldolase
MKEKYTGPKFKTVLEKKKLSQNQEVRELIFWCKKFDKLGLTPKEGRWSAGNLSFRKKEGFIITGSSKDMAKINIEGLAFVKKCDSKKKEAHVQGLTLPSSETFLHWFIYKKRKDVKAIFHGHNKKILEKATKLKIVQTKKERPYGTIQLAKEVLKVLNKNNFIILKNHGFLSMGKSMKEAGKLAISVFKKCSKA